MNARNICQDIRVTLIRLALLKRDRKRDKTLNGVSVKKFRAGNFPPFFLLTLHFRMVSRVRLMPDPRTDGIHYIHIG